MSKERREFTIPNENLKEIYELMDNTAPNINGHRSNIANYELWMRISEFYPAVLDPNTAWEFSGDLLHLKVVEKIKAEEEEKADE